MHYGLNVATGIEEAITALRDRECRICLLTRVERKVVGGSQISVKAGKNNREESLEMCVFS